MRRHVPWSIALLVLLAALPAGSITGPDPAHPFARDTVPLVKPAEGVWATFDFIPGDRVLLVEDFSKDEVGSFPRRFARRSGALEIIQWNRTFWLRAESNARFEVPLPEALPARFTLELDAYVPGGAMRITFGDDERIGLQYLGPHGEVRVHDAAAKVMSGRYSAAPDCELRTIRVMADGDHVRVYVDQRRLVDAGAADLQRSARIRFSVDASDDEPAILGNLRVTTESRSLADALLTEGRAVVRGLYFEAGTEQLRGESTPTLREIARLLTAHPELALLVEGHSDGAGPAAAAQSLTERRAAAVKAALVESFGVAAERLTTVGAGAARPLGRNDTLEGRMTNQRVELVKR
ncbi:MAG TPA: OmpA family protein [Gemmatimonadaceae bacterium]|nr:OmpA family protein [Gemmatimonadaceae bacterium]